MSDVDDLLQNLREMRSNESNPQDILQQLLAIQNRVKYCNFQKYNSEKLISIFGDFWLFLLYTSAQTSNNSIIISTIRTAAIILFNISPFFPRQLQESFSTIAMVSTIDMATSSLIASVFGFISFHISIPYRDTFLASCPIFHHITQSQNCQEYFISSLSHYSHLGSEWHQILLKSFISKIIEDRHDKLYWRAIVKIVTDDPESLFIDVYNTVSENKIYEYHIQFMSTYLTIPNAPLNELDLFEIAKYCLTILTNNQIFDETERPLTCNEKSSIFTILAIQSHSFNIQITKKSGTVLTIVLSNMSGTENIEQELKISDLNESPDFYLLDLPIELVFPKGDEGPTLLAAKMTLLVKYLNSDDEELVNKILGIIQTMSSKPYDTTVSACFQGISKSLFYIHDKGTVESLLRILYPSIFCESTSWFHDLDRLKVLKAIPLEAIVTVTGKKMLFSVFDRILIWAKEKNEKLAKAAQEVIVDSFMAQSDREILIQRVIDQCDIFDGHDLVRTLQIFNYYLSSNKRTPPLISFCKTIIQLLAVFADDPEIYTEICRFLSYFKIRKLKPHTLNICIAVIIATYRMITGTKPTVQGLSESLISAEYNMIESITSKQSFDIINENLNEYKTFVPFLYETMQFLLSVKKFDYTYLEPIITYTIKFFPFEATSLLFKHWTNISSDIKVAIFVRNHGVIGLTSDFKTTGMWFEMYMNISSKEIPNPSHVAPVPYMHIGSSYKNMIPLETVKLTFRGFYDSLKEYLHMSLPYFNKIDDNSLLHFLHFEKFVDPMKPFDFERIAEPKRSRVIALLNEPPSTLRQTKHRKYTTDNIFEMTTATEEKDTILKEDSPDLISFDNAPLRVAESAPIRSALPKPFIEDTDSQSVSSTAGISSTQCEEDTETFRDDFYVSIAFEFVRPSINTIAQLKERLSRKDPLVEVQLKYDLYEFTSDELTNIYEYFFHKPDNKAVLEAVEQYSKRHNIEYQKVENSQNQPDLNLNHICKNEILSKQEILQVAKYLNDNYKPPEQVSCTVENKHLSTPNLIDLHSSVPNLIDLSSNIKHQVQQSMNTNLIDLTTNEVHSSTPNLIDFDPIPANSNQFYHTETDLIDLLSSNQNNSSTLDECQLLKFLLLMITQTTKKKKLRCLLLALSNLICFKSSVTPSDFKQLMSVLTETYDKLPKYDLSACLLCLSKRMGKRNRLATLLTRLGQETSFSESHSLIIANSYCHIYQPKDISLLAKKLIIDNTDNLFSSIRTGLRMISIVTDQDPQPALDYFIQIIPSILDIRKKCGRCEIVHREVAALFKVMFTDKSLSKLEKRQKMHLSKLLPFKLPTNAVFSSYSTVIPNLVNLFLLFESYSEIPSFFHSCRSVFYIDTYFDLIKIEYKEASNKREMVKDKLEQFGFEIAKNKIQITLFPQYVYHWILFLRDDYEFLTIINLMSPLSQLYFEFFFIGVMMFIKDYKNEISQDEIKLVTKWKSKVHSKAFQYALTFDKELVKAGIELSCFSEDCNESNEIISRFQPQFAKIRKRSEEKK